MAMRVATQALLESHPAVRSAVVVGVPCPDLGRALHAVVYTERNKVTSDELRAFCVDNV